MKRYISDLHFGDEECINRFDKRQFDNVYEMDKYMIKQWNNTIKSGDIVIILGDLFSTKDVTRINKILNQLSVVDKQGFMHIGQIDITKNYDVVTMCSTREKIKQGYIAAKSHGVVYPPAE